MKINASDQLVVEWALLGKDEDDAEYRVLKCSNGMLHENHFKGALIRYSPGTLKLTELPQVTISWLRLGESESRRYIAIGIHRKFDGVDVSHRELMQTSFFCVPYEQLADRAVSYLAMYEGFSSLDLAGRTLEPLRLDLGLQSYGLTAGLTNFAKQAAALLLARQPVCVLGADWVTMVERLRFIDAVASWLPYGMRSTLSASTWTNSNFRSHKMRLFFSAADRGERDNGERDYVVTWGRPDSIPPGDGFTRRYLQVLDRRALTQAHLAEQKTPTGFDDVDIARMLQRLDSVKPESRKQRLRKHASDGADQPRGFEPVTTSAPNAAGQQQAPASQAATEVSAPASPEQSAGAYYGLQAGAYYGWPAGGLVPSAKARPDINEGEVEVIAYSGEVALTHGDSKLLSNATKGLQACLHERALWESNPTIDLIAQHRLLRPPSVHIDQELLCEFYTALLKLAFSQPLTYQDYCQVEKLVGCQPGQRLHPSLARAMLLAKLEGPARLLVRDSLSHDYRQIALRDFPIRPYESVAMLIADPPPNLAHAKVIFRQAADNLDIWHHSERDQLQFREAMDHHKLLWALQERYAEDPQFQYDQLAWVFQSAYDKLDRRTAAYILEANPFVPTTSLLAAMVVTVEPKDASAVLGNFARYSLSRTPFSPQTNRRLEDLLATLRGPLVQPGPTPSSRKPWLTDAAFNVLVIIAIAILVLIAFFVIYKAAQGNV